MFGCHYKKDETVIVFWMSLFILMPMLFTYTFQTKQLNNYKQQQQQQQQQINTACANESSEDVLVLLAEAYPESKTSVDKRKRTPLHFALGHTERPANVATVVLLSGTGAALMADENGMLVSFFV